MLEKRQQQIRELRAKHDRLRRELEEAKTRLMLHPDKWTGECEFPPFSVLRVWEGDVQKFIHPHAKPTGYLISFNGNVAVFYIIYCTVALGRRLEKFP